MSGTCPCTCFVLWNKDLEPLVILYYIDEMKPSKSEGIR